MIRFYQQYIGKTLLVLFILHGIVLCCKVEGSGETATGDGNSGLRALFTKVMGTSAEKQNEVWTGGIQKIPSQNLELSDETFNDLGTLLDSLNSQRLLSPKQVVDDLLKLNWGIYTKKRLTDLKNTIQFQSVFQNRPKSDIREAEVPSTLRELMLNANILSARGDIIHAIQSYERAIKEYPDQKDIGLKARRSLVQMLLIQDPFDYEAVQKQLKEFPYLEESDLANDFWNYSCRAFLRHVALLPPKDRLVVWREGISKFDQAEMALSKETFTDLDRLSSACNNDDSLSPIQIYTDLILLVPDVESMRKLEWRRIDALVKSKQWMQALQASEFDVFMSIVSLDGPRAPVKRCEAIIKQADMPEDAMAQFKKGVNSGKITCSKEDTCIDGMLKKGAGKLIKRVKQFHSLRKQTYLNLFAGNTQEALAESSALVKNMRNDEANSIIVMNDFVMIRSIISRNYQSGYRSIAEFVTKNPELKAASEEVTRWQKKSLIDYGQSAIHDRDSEWAQIFWVWAINEEDAPESAISLINSFYEKVKSSASVQDNLKILESIYPDIKVPAGQQQILYKMAALKYEEGKFADSLKILDQADCLKGGRQEEHDVSEGFMRALSLIQLQKYSDAVSLLSKMEKWSGTDEEHARALFLIGWVHLQENNKDQAMAALRQVSDLYPATSFASKAQELIKRLEGM